jgi:hypothetical protein
MKSPELLQLLTENGITGTLDQLAGESATAFPRSTLEDMFADHGLSAPADAVQKCMNANLLEPFGARLGISSFGRRTLLLLEALEGGDVEHVFRRLRRMAGARETYELVRQGMTTRFFKSLVDHPGVARLFFCSPWIHPSKKEAAILKHTAMQIAKRGAKLDVLVLTRPPRLMPNGTEGGLQCFKDVDARFFFHSRLHSKLYIREPDANGGLSMAIVGSQNLTRSKHLEVGIRINNDSRMIDELIRYFLELTGYSSESEEA